MRVALIILIFFLFSCQGPQKHELLNCCIGEEIELSNGIVLTDRFDNFSFILPDTVKWKPIFNYHSFGIDFAACDTSEGYLRCFGITKLMKPEDWNTDWSKHQHEIDSIYLVVDSGMIKLNDMKHHWNLIKFDEIDSIYYTLFITIDYLADDFYYTLSITTRGEYDFKKRICQMIPLIKSFTILNLKTGHNSGE